MRSRAKEWGVEDGRLGVMVFFAGGAPAPMAETRFNKKLHQPFWPARDNDRSHVVTTAKFYLAYEAAEIFSERHVYSTGGHGFGMLDKNAPVSTRTPRLEDWRIERSVLSKP